MNTRTVRTQSKENKRIYNYIRELYYRAGYELIQNLQNDGKIVKFQFNPKYFEQFLNLVDGEIIECVEGCLLDNFLIYSKLGTIVVYEHYLNCGSSDFLILIQDSKETEIETQWWKYYEKNVEEE